MRFSVSAFASTRAPSSPRWFPFTNSICSAELSCNALPNAVHALSVMRVLDRSSVCRAPFSATADAIALPPAFSSPFHDRSRNCTHVSHSVNEHCHERIYVSHARIRWVELLKHHDTCSWHA